MESGYRYKACYNDSKGVEIMYDFEIMVDRTKEGSIKWDTRKYNGVPFGMADTDFKLAPQIKNGLAKVIENNVLGYTHPTDEYYEAVVSWFKRRHNTIFDKSWFFDVAGVLEGIGMVIDAYTQVDEAVMIFEPVYHPFRSIIASRGRSVSSVPLIINNNRYVMDFARIEKQIVEDEVKLLVFCSPHNPVGRVWERDELERLAQICKQYGVIVLSDEIHADITAPNVVHTVFSNVYDQVIVAISASKAFNLAGLQTAALVVSDEKLNQKLRITQAKRGLHTLNAIGPLATMIAFNDAEDWVDEFNLHIYNNHQYLKNYLETHLPNIRVAQLEGSYLQWIDFRDLMKDDSNFDVFLDEYLQMDLDPGELFGGDSTFCIRLNIAVSRGVLEAACLRVVDAVESFLNESERLVK